MEQPPPFRHTPPPGLTLHDPWEPDGRQIQLDGPLERQRFPPLLMAFVVLIAGFIIFQVVAAIATLALIMINGASMDDLVNFESLMMDNLHVILIGNTIGQFFGLALPVWLLVFLHTKYNLPFIRLRPTSMRMIGLSLAGLVALVPLTWWIGNFNSKIPQPEWLEQLEMSQINLIEQVILQDISLPFLLAMMAITPAICEEIVFRGYIQRQFERSTGVILGIVLSGVFFGAYHLRLTQVLPLALIGVYLAYLTWRTGSLWPAIVVHFANNAFSLTLGEYLTQQPDFDIETLEQVDVPIGIVLGAGAALAGIIFLMHRAAEEEIGPDAESEPLHQSGLPEV